MRVYLKLSKNTSIVPFNHIPVLVGALHKWLSRNEWHSQLSFHSFSSLKGSRKGNNGLYFPNGAEWFISAHDAVFIKRVIQGIQNDPTINYGLFVKSIVIQEDPVFGDNHSFSVASPILIKRREGDRVRHYLFSDKEADGFMTETLITKLKKAGLNAAGVQITFNKNYPFSKTKLIDYNGIGNRGSVCPVTITGTPEQIAFAWNVGVGNSTGIGFGALN